MRNLADAFKAKGVTNRQAQPFRRERGGIHDELLKFDYVEFRGTASFILSPKGWAWVTAQQQS